LYRSSRYIYSSVYKYMYIHYIYTCMYIVYEYLFISIYTCIYIMYINVCILFTYIYIQLALLWIFVSLLMPYWLSLCVLRRTCKRNRLWNPFPCCIILGEYHHYKLFIIVSKIRWLES
jgi:small-conductance mechanosensitive channel